MARKIDKKPSFAHPRYWGNWLVVGVLWCLGKLPFHWAMACGRGLGWLACRVMKSRQRVVLTNLQLCFPQLSVAARYELMQQTFAAFGQGIVGAAIAWWGCATYIKKLTHITGIEHLQHAVANKEPTVLIYPHLYTLEIVGRILSQYVPVSVMYQHQSSAFFDHLMLSKRAVYLEHVIDRRNIKQYVRLLQQGHLMSYAPDQDFGPTNSVFAPFFEVPTATATSTARIVGRCNAKVLFLNCVVTRQGFSVTVSPPITNFPTGDAVLDATTINANIEKIILTDISNYMWLHKRFKTRPEGAASVY